MSVARTRARRLVVLIRWRRRGLRRRRGRWLAVRVMRWLGRLAARRGRLGRSGRRCRLGLRLRRPGGGRRRARLLCHVGDGFNRGDCALGPCTRVRAAGDGRRGKKKDRECTGDRQRRLHASEWAIASRRLAVPRPLGLWRRRPGSIQGRPQALVKTWPSWIVHLCLPCDEPGPSLDDNEAGR